jgi:hypothetical protein
LCGLDVASLLEAVGRWQEWLERGRARPEVSTLRVIKADAVL